MASKEAIVPVVCWLFAGVFSRILRESGLAAGVAGLAAGSASMGFFRGDRVYLLRDLRYGIRNRVQNHRRRHGGCYPAGLALGAHPGILAGAIISGAAFGDNLAPISDTTICSAASQGVDVPGVVRSRLKYALAAAALTIAAITVAGGGAEPIRRSGWLLCV